MQFGLFSLFDFFPDRQNEVTYYKDSLELMIYADRLGFDSVWIGEEHFYSFGICPSPQLFLTALARETSQIRLGTAISLLPFEHPLRKAEDFAMLDILSNGRLNFGVGRGLIPKHFEGFQVKPQESRARYEESLAIIEKAWTEDAFSYEGRFWQIPELSLSPKPIQKPCPPIYRGLASPEGYESAGIKGHGGLIVPWLSGAHPEVRKSVERYRTIAREHGHQHVPTVFVFWLFIDQDYQRAVTEAREVTQRYVDLTLQFIPRTIVDNLPPNDPRRLFWQQITSMPSEVESRALVGAPSDCRRRLAELRDEFGIDHIAFYLHAGARDIGSARRGLELCAKEVMPEFRQ
jgi:alkanesulfonate monooxygenase SsuD/methylene tetrahydromethanopterin reductase-like flavin-dependent oxidoreductase (luciferase family)